MPGPNGSSGVEGGEEDRSPLAPNREELLSVREEMVGERSRVGGVIDGLGHLLATPAFVSAFVGAHVLWVLLNVRLVPGVEPWDPYPFTLLATIASVEAPFVALMILMRQARDRMVEEVRNEVSLQVTLRGEREMTLLIHMMEKLGERLDVQFEDREMLEDLREDIDAERLMSAVEESLHRSGDNPPGEES